MPYRPGDRTDRAQPLRMIFYQASILICYPSCTFLDKCLRSLVISSASKGSVRRKSWRILKNDKLCPCFIYLTYIFSTSHLHMWCCPNQVSRHFTIRPKSLELPSSRKSCQSGEHRETVGLVRVVIHSWRHFLATTSYELMRRSDSRQCRPAELVQVQKLVLETRLTEILRFT